MGLVFRSGGREAGDLLGKVIEMINRTDVVLNSSDSNALVRHGDLSFRRRFFRICFYYGFLST